MMLRYLTLLSLLCLGLSHVNAFELKKFMEDHKFYSRTNLKYLEEGQVVVSSTVTTDKGEKEKKQKLDLYFAGLHSRDCAHSIQKLSQYEKFSEYISFIEKSTFDEKTKLVTLFLDGSPFLPKFSLETTIDRISKPDVYPFVMGAGMFQGLSGNLHIIEAGQRCLYYIKGDYFGKTTGMPDWAVEGLANTISKKGLERLFIISDHKAKN